MSQSSSPLTQPTGTPAPTSPTSSTGTYVALPAVAVIAVGAFVAGLAVSQFLPPVTREPKIKRKAEVEE